MVGRIRLIFNVTTRLDCANLPTGQCYNTVLSRDHNVHREKRQGIYFINTCILQSYSSGYGVAASQVPADAGQRLALY
jgi:hypothetical protein